MFIFRVHEQEVKPNYNMANLKGNAFPRSKSLLNIRMSLKSGICAELQNNYNLVWQILCSLTDDNLKATICSFKW